MKILWIDSIHLDSKSHLLFIVLFCTYCGKRVALQSFATDMKTWPAQRVAVVVVDVSARMREKQLNQKCAIQIRLRLEWSASGAMEQWNGCGASIRCSTARKCVLSTQPLQTQRRPDDDPPRPEGPKFASTFRSVWSSVQISHSRRDGFPSHDSATLNIVAYANWISVFKQICCNNLPMNVGKNRQREGEECLSMLLVWFMPSTHKQEIKQRGGLKCGVSDKTLKAR